MRRLLPLTLLLQARFSGITVRGALALLVAFHCVFIIYAQDPPTEYQIKLSLRQIFIAKPAPSGDEKIDKEVFAAIRKRADSLVTQAAAGADFEQLAKDYSEDPATATQGGALGWVGRGQLVHQAEETAFSLGKGDVSVAFEIPSGFLILKLEDVQLEPKPRPATTASKSQPAVVTPDPRAVVRQRWPDPNNPRQMAVGKTTAELRAECARLSEKPSSPTEVHTADDRSYDCAVMAVQMEPEYEELVDKAARLQRELCLKGNGTIPPERPANLQGSREFDEMHALAREFSKRFQQTQDEYAAAGKAASEAAQAQGWRTNPLGQVAAKAHARALRAFFDMFRVGSNCGRGY